MRSSIRLAPVNIFHHEGDLKIYRREATEDKTVGKTESKAQGKKVRSEDKVIKISFAEVAQ
jgi:hypothetical protein